MAQTLWDVLGAITDQRGRKGRQLPLAGILAIAVAAMAAGANDLRAIFRWGRRLTPEALALFGLDRAPCHATYHYVFRSLDGDDLSKVFGAYALANAHRAGAKDCGDPVGGPVGELGHIAIDGKTLKGSRRLDSRALHVVAAFATEVSVVIGDRLVDPEHNEITAALALLKDLPLKGAIFTGDAIFCQREICQEITAGGGDYLFVVKDNQPELKSDIAESFGDLSPLGRR
jgi:DDE_Tnp_1-associated/Transposase DDE domain